jgi:hypothetical protein
MLVEAEVAAAPLTDTELVENPARERTEGERGISDSGED